MHPVRIGSLTLGRGRPLVFILGPCVIESPSHALDLALALREIGARTGVPVIFKASYDKANRTSGSSYRGPGLEAGLAAARDVLAGKRTPRVTGELPPPVADTVAIELYGGPAAEPALGPTAFPHRFSAMSNPVAPMGPGKAIHVRLMFKGKPLPNTKVSFIPRGTTLAEGFDRTHERMTDASGRAHLAGATWTNEGSFPVIDGPDLTFNGVVDAFVARLSPDGSFAYFGGNDVTLSRLDTTTFEDIRQRRVVVKAELDRKRTRQTNSK